MTCWEWPFPAVNSRFTVPALVRASLVAWPLAFQAPRRGPGVEHTRTTGRETLLDFSLECSFHVVVLWCPPRYLPLGSQEVVGPSLWKEERKKW